MVDFLTFSREENGDYRASWRNFYHATGWNRDLAVRRLASFMADAHSDIWHTDGLKEVISDYFRPLSANEYTNHTKYRGPNAPPTSAVDGRIGRATMVGVPATREDAMQQIADAGQFYDNFVVRPKSDKKGE